MGKTKEMGWNRQRKVKIFRKRIGELRKLTSGQRLFTARVMAVCEAAGGEAARKGGTPGEGPPFTPSCAL